MTKYLNTYLNDQLALGVGWRELARRAASAEEPGPLRSDLERVAGEIAEDVRTFEALMDRLGVARSRVKPALAIAGERAGRLKPNGHLRTRSPLSRFLELDALVMGLDGKVTLWANLRDLAGLGERLGDVDFDALAERARAQRATLTPHHAAAGAAALRA